MPVIDDMLPPVVDVELYGAFRSSPPDPVAVRTQLDALLTKLEAHYGVAPIIYSPQRTDADYVAGHFEHHDIWIADMVFTPTLADRRAWTFWQYSNRQRLPGYAGPERSIDLNLFAGTAEQFEQYGRG